VKRLLAAWLMLFSAAGFAQSRDVLGVHDLSSGGSRVKGGMSSACLYCHAPHTGIGKGPLWSQQLSTQIYTQLYSSDTLQNTPVQPPLGESSSLCLSCHDGTVAPGQTAPYGPIQLSQAMTNGLLPNMAASHPFSLKLPLKDAANLVSSLAASGTTADLTNAVKLIKGNLECTSCHDGHNQRLDQRSQNFLVKDNANGALCLACHDVTSRTVNTIQNPLSQWTPSIHAKSGALVNASAGLGSYDSVAQYACLSCHVPHNAGGLTGLLRAPSTTLPNVDAASQSCANCHAGGTALISPILNVFDVVGAKGHPYATETNKHTPGESVVLNQNRHATCADCHNGHAAQATVTFDAAPGVRPSQFGVPGVAADGSLLSNAAANQYEICLRCHGNSIGKQALTATYGYLPLRGATGGDALNLIYQFGSAAVSKHPVMTDARLINQPSLLTNMWAIGGSTPSRLMGTRILCSDCHNSDNNREFGGSGPNGPHGSNNDHILERPYLISQVAANAAPGTPVVNLILNLQPGDSRLQPGSNGPFELCAKCHNLNSIMSDVSFTRHSLHLGQGFSCSVCHSAHGVPSGNANYTGERLVNFDLNVVAPSGSTLSYINGSCTLRCHGQDHQNIK
jgi:predicted CXXCH cytochrome family protein